MPHQSHLGVSAHIAMLFVATCLFASAEGHGYLKIPASRNFLANSDYCPQCLNAGGPGTVGSGGKIWPDGNHGICGDVFTDAAPRKHEAGGAYWTGKSAATYQQGGVVKLTTVLTAFHRGRFGFRLCKIEGTSASAETSQLTEACFNQNILVQANVPGAQAPGDPYFHLGSNNTGTFEAYYQLPSGLVCDGTTSRCVIQFYYLTGNSCNPPNEPSQYTVSGLQACGTSGANYPEEFWNCADITISSSGSIPSPSPTASPIPSPPPKASPVPSPPPKASPIPSPPPSPKASPSPSPAAVPSPPPSLSPKSPPPATKSPSPSPSPAGSAKTFCAATGAFGYFADRAVQCTAFYRCEPTGSWYYLCPSGLKFNEAVSTCDYPANVSC